VKDVSVVVVSYNTRDLLRESLAAVERHRGALDIETLVVDNDSRDGSAEEVAASFPQVRLLRNATNRGFAAAANQGMREGTGRYLFLLNPDAAVREGTLPRLVSFLDGRAEAGAAGCRLTYADGRLQPSCASFPNLLNYAVLSFASYDRMPRPRRPMRRLQECWTHDATREVDCVSGAAMMVRREVMEKVGPLDERFFLYGEEKDWCWRMREAGWKTLFLPDAEVVHHGRASSRQNPDAIAHLHRGQVLFLRKHYGPARRLLLRGLLAAGAAGRWALLQGGALLRRTPEARLRARRYRRALRFHLDPGFLPLDPA
jgi:GT2 family glycosyltransferase